MPMQMGFRWYGEGNDQITLNYIKQIPGVTSIVWALHHKMPGEIWEESEIAEVMDQLHAYGFNGDVVESVNVHDDIKIGLPTRDALIENYKQTMRNLAKFGVKVLPPDINESNESFSVSGGNIRFGLLAIKNVGRKFADDILRERGIRPFKSFDEFVRRMIKTDINKRTLESMIKCGVFDSFGITRNSLMSVHEDILNAEHGKIRNNIAGQIDLFSMPSSVASVSFSGVLV